MVAEVLFTSSLTPDPKWSCVTWAHGLAQKLSSASKSRRLSGTNGPSTGSPISNTACCFGFKKKKKKKNTLPSQLGHRPTAPASVFARTAWKAMPFSYSLHSASHVSKFSRTAALYRIVLFRSCSHGLCYPGARHLWGFYWVCTDRCWAGFVSWEPTCWLRRFLSTWSNRVRFAKGTDCFFRKKRRSNTWPAGSTAKPPYAYPLPPSPPPPPPPLLSAATWTGSHCLVLWATPLGWKPFSLTPGKHTFLPCGHLDIHWAVTTQNDEFKAVFTARIHAC